MSRERIVEGPWVQRKGDPCVICWKPYGLDYSITIAETFGTKAEREAAAALIALAPEMRKFIMINANRGYLTSDESAEFLALVEKLR